MRNRVFLATVLALMGGPWSPIGRLHAGPIGSPSTAETAAADQPAELRKAIAAFRQGDFRSTLQWLKQARREHPGLAPPEVMLANMFFSDGQPQRGRETLEKAAVKHAGDPEPHLIFGELAFREGRKSDAHVQYQRCAELTAALAGSAKRKQDLRARALAGLARVAEARGEFETARRKYSEVLTVNPRDAHAHFRLGNVLFALGRPEDALTELRSAAGLLKEAPSPALTMAELYSQAGNLEKADQWVQQAIQEAPQDPKPHLVMARWQLEVRNDPQAALPFVERAAELSPGSLDASILRGLIAWSLGDFAEAERALEAAALKHPGNSQANNYLAAVLAEKPSPETRRAREILDLTASTGARSPETVATLGWVAYQRGELEQAEQQLARAVASSDASRDAKYYLARTLFRRGKIVASQQALRQALAGDGMFIHLQQAREWLRELDAPGGAR